MVPAVVGAYRCNGTVDWLEEEHPYYPPTVNDAGAAEFAKGVAGKLLGAKNVSLAAQIPMLGASCCSRACHATGLTAYLQCFGSLTEACPVFMYMHVGVSRPHCLRKIGWHCTAGAVLRCGNLGYSLLCYSQLPWFRWMLLLAGCCDRPGDAWRRFLLFWHEDAIHNDVHRHPQ